MPTHAERLARLEQQMTSVAEDVSVLRSEVNGPGVEGRSPLRARMHALEGARSAESAARSAISALQAQHAATTSARDRRVFALVGTLLTAANIALTLLIR